MLGRGSSRLNMLGRGSPRFNMLLSKAAQNKKSPIATASKTHEGSPEGIHVGSFLLVLVLSYVAYVLICRENKSKLEFYVREDP
jgi:hypothetical protein